MICFESRETDLIIIKKRIDSKEEAGLSRCRKYFVSLEANKNADTKLLLSI